MEGAQSSPIGGTRMKGWGGGGGGVGGVGWGGVGLIRFVHLRRVSRDYFQKLIDPPPPTPHPPQSCLQPQPCQY